MHGNSNITESVRNMQSDLAVTNKQYCQSCILLVLYIIQAYPYFVAFSATVTDSRILTQEQQEAGKKHFAQKFHYFPSFDSAMRTLRVFSPILTFLGVFVFTIPECLLNSIKLVNFSQTQLFCKKQYTAVPKKCRPCPAICTIQRPLLHTYKFYNIIVIFNLKKAF